MSECHWEALALWATLIGITWITAVRAMADLNGERDLVLGTAGIVTAVLAVLQSFKFMGCP